MHMMPNASFNPAILLLSTIMQHGHLRRAQATLMKNPETDKIYDCSQTLLESKSHSALCTELAKHSTVSLELF